MSQFSVVFGKATSVTRNVITDIQTGDAGSGTVKTTHSFVEQAVVVSDSGQQYPVTLNGVDPFVFEGGEYALTVRNGVAVVITSVGTGGRYWINGGPEAEVRLPTFRLFVAILMIVTSIPIIWFSRSIAYGVFNTDDNMSVLLTGVILLVLGTLVAVRTSNQRDDIKQTVSRRRALRTAFLDGALKLYRERGRTVASE